MVTTWIDQGTMGQIQKNKLVFVETTDFVETTVALDNYIKVRNNAMELKFSRLFHLLNLESHI